MDFLGSRRRGVTINGFLRIFLVLALVFKNFLSAGSGFLRIFSVPALVCSASGQELCVRVFLVIWSEPMLTLNSTGMLRASYILKPAVYFCVGGLPAVDVRATTKSVHVIACPVMVGSPSC